MRGRPLRRAPGSDPTNVEDSEADRLFDEALRLVLRLQEAPADPAAREALRLWRAKSPAHEAAWREMAEIHGLAGRALTRERAKATRRGFLLGAAGLGAAAASAALAPGLILAARADRRTGAARLEGFDLPEGRAVLGPKSALALEPEGARLLAGMLWCELAPGAAPFSLRIGALELRGLRGAFGVSAEAGFVTAEAGAGGAAELHPPAAAPESLAAGGWARFDAEGGFLARGGRSAAPAAWLEGRLIAEAEPLAALVARIARWLPERVVLLDSALGARRVSGVFDLSAPREALRAAVRPHGGRLREIPVLGTIFVSA